MTDNNDPVRLRERAAIYEQVALRITDDQALRALHDMARHYRDQADDLAERATVSALQGLLRQG
jgi:hypothetical protein